MAASLEETERQLGVILGAWGLASTVAGSLLWARAGDEERRAFGRQTAAWGAVDLAIATAAHLRAARRDRPMDERDRRRLYRLLVVNSGLDVVYVVGGAAVAAQADRLSARWPGRRPRSADQLRGDGSAVVLQGLFLFVLDSSFARRIGG
jgi:hypothetical protein